MIGRIFRALDEVTDKLDKKPPLTETLSADAEAVPGSADQHQAPRKRPVFAGKWEPIRFPVKTCPRCAESVKRDAKICKHCAYGFNEADEATVQSAEAEETEALIKVEGGALKLQKGCLVLTIFAVVIVALSACGAQTPSQVDEQHEASVPGEPRAPSDESVQEARREKLAFLQDSPATTWKVTLHSIAVCPSAADWYPGAEAIERLEPENIPDLPDRCWRLKMGETVKLPPAGMRKIDIHADHVIMQAHTATGREFWTDELDQLAIEPAS